MQRSHILIAVLSVLVANGHCQRAGYAGRRPIGYPSIEPVTTQEDLGNRFGDGDNNTTTTTEKLPIEALGDRELFNRLKKLPVDKQPFWFINWQALENERKSGPKTYPQRVNTFIDQSSGIGNQNLQNRVSENNQNSNLPNNQNTNLQGQQNLGIGMQQNERPLANSVLQNPSPSNSQNLLRVGNMQNRRTVVRNPDSNSNVFPNGSGGQQRLLNSQNQRQFRNFEMNQNPLSDVFFNSNNRDFQGFPENFNMQRSQNNRRTQFQ